MSRDRLTRATPDIAEPDTDRPKTGGARHNHTQTDRETLRHIGKRASRHTETTGTANQIQTETKTEAY